ncbi:hypothetical protein HQN64_00370 [Enterobacteriaceae bacterium BIT-l23]|uniref:Uncharacterized protein n=1 Tax=Jejubacter calystegiae TaxID=2579935 RepID=A0A4P8YK91_9ENTR|nr:hypothetical protein [Jejubacter calystegiae]NUU64565.1 hypothetical protein [Enterobacteriaceae bacterium BIT-l23]QCT20074.1 hypothetical protein FEM41_10640 [Jejubacter calystegiae]
MQSKSGVPFSKNSDVHSQSAVRLNPNGQRVCAGMTADAQTVDFDNRLAVRTAMQALVSQQKRTIAEVKARLIGHLLLPTPEQAARLTTDAGFSKTALFPAASDLRLERPYKSR